MNFVKLTEASVPNFINLDSVRNMKRLEDGTHIHFLGETYPIVVKETPEEIMALSKKVVITGTFRTPEEIGEAYFKEKAEKAARRKGNVERLKDTCKLKKGPRR